MVVFCINLTVVVFWIFRFVSSSVYYGLNFNTGNLAGNLYLNVFISGLVEIPALVYVVALNNRIGRRKITLSLMLLAGISCLAVLVVTLIGMWVTCTYVYVKEEQHTIIIVFNNFTHKNKNGCCSSDKYFEPVYNIFNNTGTCY